jgi:alkylation response protein AidB-like acyl-CoA dehydrogenase
MSTMFPYEDPDEGLIVLNMAVPMGEGVTVLDTWDALGMRGTGSHDIEIKDVFIPDERVMARRPHGKLDPPFQVILSNAMPPVAAVYLGVAEAARDHAVALVSDTSRAADPLVQRQIGLMDTRLRVAGWALDGALAIVGDDPEPSMDTVVAVLAAKREIALAGAEVCELALSVGGGAAFYRTQPIEQCFRDMQGARYHPLTPEESLVHAGLVALGLPADER